MPRGGRRRREGTRWFADIHATPQAYHAGPDAVIHRSAWKKYSPKSSTVGHRRMRRGSSDGTIALGVLVSEPRSPQR